MMRKLAILLGALVLVAVVVVGLALFPTEAKATCVPIVDSVTGWGTGATCQASKDACEDDAVAKAVADCDFGVCEWVSLTFTNECVPHQGGYMSDCIQEYRCTSPSRW